MVLLALVVGSAWADEGSGIAWDKRIDNAEDRFQVLNEFDDAAVLDQETQLVWEQAPAVTTHTWAAARNQYTTRTTGGRKGWRLPSVHELASLVDPNNPTGDPDLPPRHPFSNVHSSVYWSATTLADDPTQGWVVNFSNGSVAFTDKGFSLDMWCVRGPMNADQY